MDRARYDVGLACLNGHPVNGSAYESSEFNAKFCKRCGEPTIDACPACESKIRGYCHVPGVISFRGWKVPAFCHQCGAPYPWTERRKKALADAIADLEELDEGDRSKLTEAIPDVISETAGTEVATARYKKAIAKAGKLSGKLLYDVLVRVATDAVTKSLGPQG